MEDEQHSKEHLLNVDNKQDWESSEEVFGTPLNRHRRRNSIPGQSRWLSSRQSVLYITALIGSWLLTFALLIYTWETRTWGNNRFQQSKLMPAQLTYSPAQDTIVYEVKTFDRDLEAAPAKFRNPTIVDEAWKHLHHVGMSAISKDEAQRLTNYTTKATQGHTTYTIQLAVFHQLHCLDTLRHALEPYYNLKDHLDPLQSRRDASDEDIPDKIEDFYLQPHHLNHCINGLRNALMCQSDISTIVWHWDDAKGRNIPAADVPHTCRNFERILEWARERSIAEHIDHYSKSPDKIDFIIPTWP